MKKTSKYRYLIYYDYRVKTPLIQYTVEEAHWNETLHQFENEIVHTVEPQTIKKLVGYYPHTFGDRATEMWLVFPWVLWDIVGDRSPLEMIRVDLTNRPFHPFALSSLRRLVPPDEWPEYHVDQFNHE